MVFVITNISNDKDLRECLNLTRLKGPDTYARIFPFTQRSFSELYD